MTRLQVNVECELPRFRFAIEADWEGHSLGIFGPSGSGKSTFLEHLMGLRRDAKGFLALNGRTLLDSRKRLSLAPEERGIGYVPQDGLLFPHWSVETNLLVGERRAKLPAAVSGRFDELVALLDLAPLLSAPVTTLSGGERRRVALARALLRDPVLLCLDEPLANLDAERRQGILAYLVGLRQWSDVPLIVVSHDATDLLALTAHTWRLEEGRIAEEGRTWQVLARQSSLATPDNVPLNLLPGLLVEQKGHQVRVDLDCGLAIHGTTRTAVLGDSVVVTLRPAELLVASDIPRGISARNRLPARILERHRGSPVGLLLLCQVAGSTPPIWVLVTDQADAELNLEEGKAVYLIAKASACQVDPVRGHGQGTA